MRLKRFFVGVGQIYLGRSKLKLGFLMIRLFKNVNFNLETEITKAQRSLQAGRALSEFGCLAQVSMAKWIGVPTYILRLKACLLAIMQGLGQCLIRQFHCL